jgi:hypothetical protein
VNARLPAELGDLSWWNAAHLRTLRDTDETRAAHRLTTAARAEIVWLIRTGLGSTRASALRAATSADPRPVRRLDAVATIWPTTYAEAADLINPRMDSSRRVEHLHPPDAVHRGRRRRRDDGVGEEIPVSLPPAAPVTGREFAAV